MSTLDVHSHSTVVYYKCFGSTHSAIHNQYRCISHKIRLKVQNYAFSRSSSRKTWVKRYTASVDSWTDSNLSVSVQSDANMIRWMTDLHQKYSGLYLLNSLDQSLVSFSSGISCWTGRILSPPCPSLCLCPVRYAFYSTTVGLCNPLQLYGAKRLDPGHLLTSTYTQMSLLIWNLELYWFSSAHLYFRIRCKKLIFLKSKGHHYCEKTHRAKV